MCHGEASGRQSAGWRNGRVRDTLKDREQRLANRNEKLKQGARTKHGPTIAGLGQAASLGAAAGGGVRLGQALWVKWREGKNPFKGEFSAEDWGDVGVGTAKGAGIGAVAGGSLYVLTNSTDLAAPFAGSLVSGLMGVGGLLQQYHAGAIDADQFVELSQLVVADAAIVGLASATGQVIIPVPILGALIGSLTGKLVASALKDGLGGAEGELLVRLEAYEKMALGRLDTEYRAFVVRLDTYFGNLERFAQVAFNEEVNTTLRLKASVWFAEMVGVRDDFILRSTDELDTFMAE